MLDSINGFPGIELHCPGIEVTEPGASPPNLIDIFVDRQETENLTAENGADKYMLVIPPKLTVVFYPSH